jgi:hypothetical protein
MVNLDRKWEAFNHIPDNRKCMAIRMEQEVNLAMSRINDITFIHQMLPESSVLLFSTGTIISHVCQYETHATRAYEVQWHLADKFELLHLN